MSKQSKGKDYKFKAQVYETKDKNEATFHQKLANKEQQEIIFRNRNLNNFAPELYNSQLEYFFILKINFVFIIFIKFLSNNVIVGCIDLTSVIFYFMCFHNQSFVN